MSKTFVFCQNASIFHNWMRQHKLSKSDYIYISRPDSLRGFRGERFIKYGEYQLHPFAEEIEMMLTERGFKQE